MPTLKRVAISGIGVVSPLGHTLAELFVQARAGRSGVHLLDTPFAQRLNSPLVASVKHDVSAS
ncbi:MAG: hypothetical protein Q8M96_11300, partial [Rubrivivax sp.]|nr:hypothetical protein [Rubrivivax sp.]